LIGNLRAFEPLPSYSRRRLSRRQWQRQQGGEKATERAQDEELL